MEKRKMTNREVRAIETKKKIYETAMELIEQYGYENVKVEQICEEAKVSVGSFYNYFLSKQNLFNEMAYGVKDYFNNYVSINLKSKDSFGKVVEYFYFYGSYVEKVGVDKIKRITSLDNLRLFPKEEYTYKVLQEIIENGQKNGEISSAINKKEICEYLYVAARGIVHDWCVHNGEYNIKEFMKSYFELLIKVFVNKQES